MPKVCFFGNFSVDFFLRKYLFLFGRIIYSTLRHHFVISGSVTGRAIFLSSGENYGQSLKCWLDIQGFPRIYKIICYFRKLSEPKKVEISRNLIQKLNEPVGQNT